ncbi:hypothetical protein [Azomonas macrocytogenes]|uniref:Uncharacterized protein n=1 Tax=Azomonas macrocytogenes TaxID=69962 RepID=A0A839TA56_AZOMA|nr:hypothetical protein [Azomonas macrocytogenes]MBB3104925.1 hypothetical protein [Azomonas macrocytogenes]
MDIEKPGDTSIIPLFALISDMNTVMRDPFSLGCRLMTQQTVKACTSELNALEQQSDTSGFLHFLLY